MEPSASHGKTVKSAFLVILMIIMTQVGYLDLINSPKTGNDSFDEESSVMETGGSSNSPTTEIRHSYQLDASGLHTCAILDNGSLMCWGLNNRGQVGDGTTTNAHTPVLVDLGSGITATEVVNGYRHTCATLSNGSLMCWGENSYGQLGNGQQTQTQTTPVWVDLGVGRTATRIAADYGKTCAIADNSSLYCWGSNNHGALGYGDQLLTTQTTPGWVDLGGNGAVAVDVGDMNVCSILNNGSLYCWGSDAYGQLGRGGPFHSSGPQANEYAPLWVDLGAGRTAAQISLGSQHMCAIYDNGSLYCWGHDSSGQLGNGSGGFGQTIGTPSWVDLGAGSTPVAVSAGGSHTCAIVDNGSLYCWGANSYGTLGIGSTQPAYSPTWVDLGVGRTALAISAGRSHTCAILDDSSLTCFGNDYNGALGNGPGQSDSSVPIIVDGGFTWDNSTGSNSGSSATDLIASSEGANLTVGQAMTNITFQYDSSAVSGSGSGSNSGTYNGNGTAWMVKNIAGGGLSSFPDRMAAVGNTLFFEASDYQNGSELWKSNGTSSGTVMVKNINSGSGNQASSYPNYLTEMGNTLYFSAMDANNGYQLWKSDGTASGTVMVTAINSGGTANPGIHTLGFVVMNNNLYFSAEDGTNGPELWKSDGTASGTMMVKDINPGSGGSLSYTPAVKPVVMNNELYFQADDGTNGYELWKSDGTASGTVMVKDINNGSGDSNPSGLIAVGNTVYFAASDGTNGYELWKSDGTASGTVMVKDINSGSGNGGGAAGAAIGSTLYFRATDGTHGFELWKSDGTASGTVMVKDINSTGDGCYSYCSMRAVGNTLYFIPNEATHGVELWKSDGTASGTVMVKDINSGSGWGWPSILTPIGNTVYFPATDGINGWEVWKSDGTASGTVMVQDINSGSANSNPHRFIAVGNTLYFRASDGTNGYELWALDPANITGLSGGGGSGSGSGGTTNVTGATCTVSPSLPNGLNIDSSTCTISGTPTVESVNQTYTVTAVISGTTFQTTVWLSTSPYTPPPTLVALNNTDIGTVSPYLVVPGGTFEISPDLPASLSIDQNTGEITGMPTQTLENTTFTVWSNHTDGTSLTYDFTIEILEDSDGDGMPDELPDDYDPTNPDSPGLIEDLDDDNDGNSDVDEATDGTSPTNPDTDGDGMCDGPVASPPDCVAGPDAFPLDPSADTDTDGDGQPDTMVPGVDSNSDPALIEDMDDDGDGLEDIYETDTGIYNDETDTGTDPLNPDTDNDGICDGPNDVLPICVAGPDTELGTAIDGTAFLLNNTPMTYLMPKYDFPNAAYEVHPALPAGIVLDPVTGVISGTPTEATDNITYTLFANGTEDGFTSSWSFNMQVLEDTDGDGMPNELPDDYPTTGEAPFDLVEDLDDDGDGASDEAETGTGIYVDGNDMGTDPLDPDTDDDGICDGPNSVLPVCIGGPDANPFGTGSDAPVVLVNNTEMTDLYPANNVPGAIWQISPALPPGLTLDVNTGIISGTPTEAMDNTTFTMWANTSEPRSVESTFYLEVLEDTDGDGMPDTLPDDYPDTGLPPFDLIEDLDDDADGTPDVDEATNGTDSLNPDTDGDGFCDGPGAVDGVCYAGPDSHPLDPALPVNTDGDAFPDEDPDGEGGLIADDDDDNDGYLDTEEVACLSLPLDANDIPDDMDGDGICDALDDDMDGDGILNDEETNTGDYIDDQDPLTDAADPDSDGDGVCDGPATPDVNICVAGPDAFPTDPAASSDTDGDGMPDEINGESTTGLIEDDDDDNDAYLDLEEIACLSEPRDINDIPDDLDGDGICDPLDDIADLPFNMTYNSQHLDLFRNKTMVAFMPNVTGLGDVASWELVGELPEGLTFGISDARSAGLDGGIRGTPVNATEEPLNITIWANNSNYQQSFALMLTVFNDTDNDSLPDSLPANYTGNLTADNDDDNDGFFDQDEINCGSDPLDISSDPTNTEGELCEKLADGGKDDEKDGLAWWCFPLCFLLLLLLLVPLLLFRDKVIGVIEDAEPENTTSKPKFVKGAGLADNPFVLKPFKTVKPGDTILSKELITITNMTPGLKVKSVDYFDRENGHRFTMQDQAGSDEGVRMIQADDEGEISFRMIFDDSLDPTLPGGEFRGAIKIGNRSVYLSWDLKVKPDPDYVKEQKRLEAERKKAKKQREKEAAEAEKNAKVEAELAAAAEAEAKAKQEAEEAEAAKKAEEEALAAIAAAEAEEKAAEKAKAKAEKEAEKKAEKEAKAAEAKAKKEAEEAEKKAKKEAEEAEKQAKAEAEAAAAAEAEAKAKKEAKEAEKKAKAESEKAKKAAAKKPATTKEAKKEEEIQRVKSRAKTINFKVIGVASSSKLKSEVKKGAKTLEVADAKEFSDSGSAAITDDKGSTVISWTGKDGNTLTGVSGVTRVFGKASVVMVKDDLQVIKGIGPFIEEKLNALGITTYRQIANMTAKLEDQVNEAIEFFPGRVKRDQWVAQAKILLGEDVKLDEKALKEAEELERIAQKADTIDFATLGVATIDEKDDLQTIKGIGPFIADKLYALGIYTFEQVGNMTPKIEEEVNKAIEFFPGRVKRDEWAKQARELHKKKK